MNATELSKIWIKTKKWISSKKVDDSEYGKICGIFQNLLEKYNTDEISKAMQTHIKNYPDMEIEGFVGYCGRIIKWERSKRRNRA